MKRITIGTALATLAALGCEPTTTPSPQPDVTAPSTAASATTSSPSAVSPTASSAGETDTKPATDVPVKPGGDAKAAVSASNAFGLSLYEQLRAGDGNLAYSPASISVALAMTYAGAKGDAANEMKATLAFPDSAEALHGGWATVISRWQGAPKVEVAVANRLFGDKKYTFEPKFLSLTKSRYGAPLEPLDFAGDVEAQRKHINDWVSGKTRKRIQDLIPKNQLSADTRMVLVNAMFFKAKWMTPFDTKRTEEASFAAPGGSVEVPMMTQTEHMRYAEVDGALIAERAYENQEFATMFVMPAKAGGLSNLESKLDADLFDSWTEALEGHRVQMTLPRFKIAPADPVELSDALRKMGMETPFQRGVADFTAMANPKNPEDRLFIEKVFHKAFVEMNEAGTEAAAATAVSMARAGGMPAEPKVFKADRPFLFFVRDTKTGMVMFAGRVMNPK